MRVEARGVSHCGLAIYILIYLKTKEELWKLKFHHAKNIIFKKSSKRNQNPSRYDVQPHHIHQCHQCQFEEILG